MNSKKKKPMYHHYTDNDLIRFLYRETTPEETVAIKKCIVADWAIRERIDAFRETMHALGRAKFSPSPTSIHIIMDYAAAESKLEAHY